MSLLKKKTVSAVNSKKQITAKQADLLADQLADKPYGEKKILSDKQAELVRTSISLPKYLLETIEDLTRKNKRKGIDPKTVSAIVRDALESYILLRNNK